MDLTDILMDLMEIGEMKIKVMDLAQEECIHQEIIMVLNNLAMANNHHKDIRLMVNIHRNMEEDIHKDLFLNQPMNIL